MEKTYRETPTVEAFEDGDVIVEVDDEDDAVHALMWIVDTRNKNIIHSKDQGMLLGVVQQSIEALRLSGSRKAHKYLVYRCLTPGVALIAANLARRWATRSDDPMVGQFLKYVAARRPGEKVRASTPFGRRGYEYQTNETWDAASLVRVVRALIRGCYGVPLSKKKGVSCSQFITYCYQAAYLNLYLHGAEWRLEQWKGWSLGPQNFVGLKKENRYALVYDALKPLFGDGTTIGIPPCFLVDAKTTDAEALLNSLDEEKENFQCLGRVAADNWAKPTNAWIAEDEEEDETDEGGEDDVRV
jgi:hypothetical protein